MAEIKISELSIGDWVMNLYANKPSRVIGLRPMFQDTYEIIAVSDDTQYMLIEDKELHNFEPIPLTPEILENNGFEEGLKNGEAYKIKVSFNQHLWLFKVEDDCWMFRLVLGLFEDFDIAKVEIKYVHQLQHALRLAGVEKEIEV